MAKGSKPRRARATGSVDDDGYLVLARTFPEAAVMEAFKEIDGVIMEYWDRMPGDKKVWMDALRPLLNEKLVSQEDIDLFHRLRLMRNTAVHARHQQRVTPAEAVEYRDLARVLVGKFRDAFEAYTTRHKAP